MTTAARSHRVRRPGYTPLRLLSITSDPQPVGETISGETIVQDAALSTYAAGGFDPAYFITVSGGYIGNDITVSTGTPSICAVDGLRATRLSDGYGSVLITDGVSDVRLTLDFNRQLTDVKKLARFIDGSLAKLVHGNVTSRFAVTPAAAVPLHTFHSQLSYYTDGTMAARNSSCLLADIDASWVSVAKSNNTDDSQGRAVLIAPDIAITSSHYHRDTAFPCTWTWRDAGGNDFSAVATLANRKRLDNPDTYPFIMDLLVMKLSTPIPADITPVQLAGPNYLTRFGNHSPAGGPLSNQTQNAVHSRRMGEVAAIAFTQDRKMVPVSLIGPLFIAGRYNNWPGLGYDGLGNKQVGGDSSAPLCTIYNGKFILHGLAFNGTVFGDLMDATSFNRLQSEITALGSASTLSVPNVTSFPTY